MTRDERVREILADHYLAVDEGRGLTRQELLARHPEYHAELAAFFEADDHWKRQRPEQSTPTLAQKTPTIRTVEFTGQRFGGYEILDEVARGGMGVIYRARQPGVQRIVALKMIRHGNLADTEDVLRFRAEAEAAAHLAHPHIVPIYDVGESDGICYFTMMLVPDGSLAEHKAEFPAHPRAAARLMAAVCRAVHYAHQHGILHRDLKPGNILLQQSERDPGEYVPFVADFGLAKRLDTDSNLTQSGAIVGTPNYMSPEQAAGMKDLTTATDTYALGSILYELLAGRKPFEAESPMATLLMVRENEPSGIASLNPKVDADLETICLKAMRKVPAERYSSAEAMAQDLENWLNGEPIQARALTWREGMARWVRRRPAVAALLALVIASNTLGLLFISRNWLEAEHQREIADQQRQEALHQRGEAEEAKKLAESNARDVQQALARAEKLLYFSSLASAQNEWSNHNADSAIRFLDDCPASQRGREWDYLDRAYRRSRLTITGAGEPLGFSRDGKRLIGRQTDHVRVWQASDGKELARLATMPMSTAFRDDDRIVTVDPKELAIWTPEGKREKRFDVAGEFRVLSADGKRLAVVTKDRYQVFDAQTGAKTHEFERKKDTVVGSLMLASEGTALMAATSTGTWVWNLESNAARELPDKQLADGISISHNGKHAATNLILDRKVHVWDVEKGEITRTLTHDTFVERIAFTSDGKSLALAGKSTVRLVNNSTGAEDMCLRGHRSMATQMILAADGSKLAVATNEPAIRVWNLDMERGTRFPAGLEPGRNVSFSADSRFLAWVGPEGQVHVHDCRDDGLRRIKTDKSVSFLEFSPDENSALLAAGGAEELCLLDAGTGEVRAKTRLSAHALSFNQEGSKIVAGAGEEVVFLETPRLTEMRRVKTGRLDMIRWVDQDHFLATTTGRLALRELTGKETQVITQGVGEVTVGADGTRVALLRDNALEVWKVNPPERVARLASDRQVFSLCLSPDYRRIVWGREDGTVKIADLDKERDLAILATRTDFIVKAVTAVRFSPNGAVLAAHAPGCITIWKSRN